MEDTPCDKLHSAKEFWEWNFTGIIMLLASFASSLLLFYGIDPVRLDSGDIITAIAARSLSDVSIAAIFAGSSTSGFYMIAADDAFAEKAISSAQRRYLTSGYGLGFLAAPFLLCALFGHYVGIHLAGACLLCVVILSFVSTLIVTAQTISAYHNLTTINS